MNGWQQADGVHAIQWGFLMGIQRKDLEGSGCGSSSFFMGKLLWTQGRQQTSKKQAQI